MKAYKISCDDDDHGQVVVFAESHLKARAKDSRDCCDCGFIELRIRRAKDFDELSPGPISIMDYLKRGWYWHCQDCDSQIYPDQIEEAVVLDDYIFCDQTCFENCRIRCRNQIDSGKAHVSIVSLFFATNDHKTH